ncbi:transposase [Rhizobium ruizarguesonis]
MFDRVAAYFVDSRDRKCTVHSTRTLVGQRIAAIVLCYEDVDDHDTLRHEPVLALLLERLNAEAARL